MKRLAFRIENCRNGVASAFPNCNDNLAPAALVPGKAAITTMCRYIGRLDVPTKIPAICPASLSSPAIGLSSRAERGTKGKPIPGPHLVYGFPTAASNAIVGADPPQGIARDPDYERGARRLDACAVGGGEGFAAARRRDQRS